MKAELTNRLENLIQHFDVEAVTIGLDPVCDRIAALFSATEENANTANLYNFCCAYIRFAPNQTKLLRQFARQLNLAQMIDGYSELALRYLESACTELENQETPESLESFLVLLQGAYIYARMQEELDDKIQAFVGVPLSATDLMDANLVIHEVIGDNFANRLDKVIESLVQQLKVSKSLIEAHLDQNQVEQAKKDQLSLIGEGVQSFAARFGLSMMSGLS